MIPHIAIFSRKGGSLILNAYKERISADAEPVPAKPCCGVYVQQVNRIATLTVQIQTWTQAPEASSIRDLRIALKRKQRMESWLAAHTHEGSLPGAQGAPLRLQQPPGD